MMKLNTDIEIDKALKCPLKLSDAALKICQVIHKSGGRCLAVGGCVRDHLLGLVYKDIDIEVYHLTINELQKQLEEHFSVHAVGMAFGVLKVSYLGETIDVALPRRENKNGEGHRGFVTTSDPHMRFKDAAQRRDFTINAMAYDILKEQFLDEFSGVDDLKKRVLRHVSPAFSEDPLRVLRACQFAARLSCSIADETITLCRSLKNELKTLPGERLWSEWIKLFSAQKPSIGLDLMLQTSALSLFPELESLIGIKQDVNWHPEGDVWIHTLMVVDQAAQISRDHNLEEKQHQELLFAALCHDFGKVECTFKEKDGRIRSLGHEEAGVKPTTHFLERLHVPQKMLKNIQDLVREHLRPFTLYANKNSVSSAAIRRLALRVDIPQLLLVAEADSFGRTMSNEKKEAASLAISWLRKRSQELQVFFEKPKAYLLGRDLIERGVKPGPDMGKILKKSFEVQLEGAYLDREGALVWLDLFLSEK